MCSVWCGWWRKHLGERKKWKEERSVLEEVLMRSEWFLSVERVEREVRSCKGKGTGQGWQ